MAKFQNIESAIVSLDKQVRQLAVDLQKMVTTVNANSKSQSDLAAKTKTVTTATKQISATEKELENVRKRSLKTTKETITAKENLRRKTKALTEEVRREQGTFKKSSGLFKGMVKSLAAVAGAYIGIQTAIRALRGAFNTIKSFSKEAAVLAGVLTKTRAETKALQDEAKRLGAIYPVTAQEVLALETAYARLGFTQKEILNLTEATIKGAIALNASQEGTAELVGAVVRSFEDLKTADAGRIMDVLTRSTQKSSLNFEKLAQALPKVAGAASAMNIPLETMVAQLSIAQDATQDASIAGTGLKKVYTTLAKTGLSMDEALGKINNSTNKVKTATELFGERAFIVGLALAKNTERAKELNTAYDEAGGTADRVAKEQMATLDGAIKGLQAAYESLILSFSESEGGLSSIINLFTTLLRNHKFLTDVIKENFAAFSDLGSALSELLKTLGIVNEETEKGVGLMKTWGTVLKVITTPIRLLTKGITLLIEQLTILAAKIDPVITKLKELSKYIGGLATLFHLAKKLIKKDNEEIVESSKEMTDEMIENEGKLTDAVISESEKQKKARLKSYDDLLKKVRTQFQRLDKELGSAKGVENFAAIVDSIESEIEDMVENETQLIKDSIDEQEEARIASYQEDLNNWRALQQKKSELADEVERATQTIITDQFNTGVDERLNSFRESEGAKQDALKNQLDKGIISEAEYEKKIKKSRLKVRQEEAKAEKKKALFDIAIATAIAVVKSLPALPLVAAVIAIGAIQAAAVAAKPIPKFKHGTDGMLQLDTTAIVGDAGQSELVTTPKGDFISPATDTMVHLPKGSQVFSGDSPETKAALSGGMSQEHYDGLIKEQQLTRKAIEGIKIYTQTPDYSMVSNLKATERIKYIDHYYGKKL
jgi:hypothetical protein